MAPHYYLPTTYHTPHACPPSAYAVALYAFWTARLVPRLYAFPFWRTPSLTTPCTGLVIACPCLQRLPALPRNHCVVPHRPLRGITCTVPRPLYTHAYSHLRWTTSTGLLHFQRLLLPHTRATYPSLLADHLPLRDFPTPPPTLPGPTPLPVAPTTLPHTTATHLRSQTACLGFYHSHLHVV